MERTLAIIKPNAIRRNLVGKIIALIEEEGLRIVCAQMKTLTREEAEQFYAEHRERPFFQGLVTFMISGPILAMVLEAPGAIEKYRKLMGSTDPQKAAPFTLRRLYGESIEANAIHGSDSLNSAQREVRFFFPEKG